MVIQASHLIKFITMSDIAGSTFKLKESRSTATDINIY